MKRLWWLLAALFTLPALSLVAQEGGQAPQFAVRSLSGEMITNYSLAGRVALLQFWATWCGYCRRDQPAVDNIEREFADRGLFVLAIDVEEPEQRVRSYLRSSPRACRVALDEDGSLARRFSAHGFPYYMVIDAEGNIAATQSGSGGEGSLRRMLARAFSRHAATSRNIPSNAGTTMRHTGPLLPPLTGRPASLRTAAVFILITGERLESGHYMISGDSVLVDVNGRTRAIPVKLLNLSATLAENQKRGIELKIPTSGSEVVLSF